MRIFRAPLLCPSIKYNNCSRHQASGHRLCLVRPYLVYFKHSSLFFFSFFLNFLFLRKKNLYLCVCVLSSSCFGNITVITLWKSDRDGEKKRHGRIWPAVLVFFFFPYKWFKFWLIRGLFFLLFLLVKEIHINNVFF